ncbi:MAG TPA: hypothetical protein VNW98_01750 [Burkholderiaceae bacterium]|nr:hypothetical protein [Burkholderiaceae bacterium]
MKPSKQRRAVLDVLAGHRRVLLILKRLHLLTQFNSIKEPILMQYEQLLDCALGSFEAEERVLRVVAHPNYCYRISAHRRIARELADARVSFKTLDPISCSQSFHCLDALVIHVTIEAAVFSQMEP